ncbi:hypothetical protein G7046_g7282 [Stylonectria norvegica]|nr:hypothetical protein G7046_g7282 [Stylonectria norvegica]
MSTRSTTKVSSGGSDEKSSRDGDDVCVYARDHSLADVPDEALTQLTRLLHMDSSVNVAQPDKWWLKRQESRIPKLHNSLRPPTNLVERLALRINGNRPSIPSHIAKLCSSHRGLDPRAIRALSRLVADECTARTDRFRHWRGRMTYTGQLVSWLDRIDSITGMWIGREAFQIVFGYNSAMPAIQKVESGCEACMMAVIGARPQLLCDLRANMVSRRDRQPKSKRRDPRLLRIIDSWISHYDEVCREAVMGASEVMATEIFDVVEEINRRKEMRNKERVAAGKPAKELHRRRRRRRHHPEEDCLPTPRQPADGRYSHRDSLPDYTGDTSQATATVPLVLDDAVNSEVYSEKHETWGWFESKIQGLSEEERQAVMGSVHPAMSEFRSPSAVPAPLNLKESKPQESEPPVPSVPSLYRKDASINDDNFQYMDQYVLSDDDADDESYVPVRRGWNTDTNAARANNIPEAPPASSFYSSHPGFPRSHHTTIVFRDPFAARRRRSVVSLESAVSPRGTRFPGM